MKLLDLIIFIRLTMVSIIEEVKFIILILIEVNRKMDIMTIEILTHIILILGKRSLLNKSLLLSLKLLILIYLLLLLLLLLLL